MDGVLQESAEGLLVDRRVSVDGGVRLLLQDVVKARRPLAAAKAGCVGAVVHHEGHAASVHVGVQAVHCFDDGLVADLAVRVALRQKGDDYSRAG